MREVQLTDTLVHEYTEYEWQDKLGDNIEDELLEIQHTGVVAAEKAGMRFFQVLVKPADELLSDTKPRNALYVDTWKYRARIKAEACQVGEPKALLALLMRLVDAKFAPGPDMLAFHVPGYGHLAVSVPADYPSLFNLPEIDSKVKCQYAGKDILLEAAFLHDRKNGNGKRTGS